MPTDNTTIEWPWTRMIASVAWAIAISTMAWKLGPPSVEAARGLTLFVGELHRECILPGTIEPCGKKGK